MKNDKHTEVGGWERDGGEKEEEALEEEKVKSGGRKGDIGGGVQGSASRWLLAGGRPQDDIRGTHFGCSCWEVLHAHTHTRPWACTNTQRDTHGQTAL